MKTAAELISTMSPAVLVEHPQLLISSAVLRADLPRLLSEIETIATLEDAEEWRAKASALEDYLTKKKMDYKPAQHLARMTEIRVGELLGPTTQGERTDLVTLDHDPKLNADEKKLFRKLAAYRDLIEPLLPSSRRKLLKAIAEAQEAECGAKMRDHGKLWNFVSDQNPISCSAIITDPPYGVLDQQWEPTDIELFTRNWLERWSQSNADFIFSFFSQRFMWDAKKWFDEELKDYSFQQLLIWHYPNNKSPQSRIGFKQTWEPIFFYRHKESNKEIKLKRGKKNWGKGINDFDCHVAAVPQSNFNGVERKVHPSQKPLSVFSWLIHAATNEGDIVADPFAGVATSGVACVRAKRLWHGIETNDNYLKLGARRLAAYARK